jgi:hypothetical protein
MYDSLVVVNKNVGLRPPPSAVEKTQGDEENEAANNGKRNHIPARASLGDMDIGDRCEIASQSRKKRNLDPVCGNAKTSKVASFLQSQIFTHDWIDDNTIETRQKDGYLFLLLVLLVAGHTHPPDA